MCIDVVCDFCLFVCIGVEIEEEFSGNASSIRAVKCNV